MMNGGSWVAIGTSTLAQLCAGWTSVLPIAALAIYGWYRGAFLATISGLQVLGSFLAAVALARPVAPLVESLGCPAAQSLAVAYVLVFGAAVVAIHLAIGATVPEGSFHLPPLLDQAASVVVGAAAGLLLGGVILVGWSMAEMPAWLRLDNTHQPLDSGGRVLWTFARFATADRGGRGLLLDGDPPAANAAATISASEPFADTNGNGRRDEGPTATAGGEPYVDVDGSGTFTTALAWLDATGDGRRSAGLRDCYRLTDWRRVRSMHAPRIVSDAAAEVTENAPLEDVVYEARATDVDGDAITYAIEPAADGGADEPPPDPGVAIDPASGAVRLVEPADFERRKSYEFVVVATDATGIADRKAVRLRVRDVALEPAAAP